MKGTIILPEESMEDTKCCDYPDSIRLALLPKKVEDVTASDLIYPETDEAAK